jgi:hypothetical protein
METTTVPTAWSNAPTLSVGRGQSVLRTIQFEHAIASPLGRESFNLQGPLNEHWLIVQPLPVNIERESAGWIILSDDIFLVYGDGPTIEAAWEDYRSSLAEYCEMVRGDAPRRWENMQQYQHLLNYIRPCAVER